MKYVIWTIILIIFILLIWFFTHPVRADYISPIPTASIVPDCTPTVDVSPTINISPTAGVSATPIPRTITNSPTIQPTIILPTAAPETGGAE